MKRPRDIEITGRVIFPDGTPVKEIRLPISLDGTIINQFKIWLKNQIETGREKP